MNNAAAQILPAAIPDDAMMDAYYVTTPFGSVNVWFPPDGGVVYDGLAPAVDHLHAVIGHAVGSDGISLTPDRMEPGDFYYTCQPPGSGVTITPPPDMVAVYAADGDDAAAPSTLDDTSGGFPSMAIPELRARLRDATVRVLDKLPIMRSILDLRAAANDAPRIPRKPSAQFYAFDENRKPSQRKRENAAALALLAQIDAGTLAPDALSDTDKATLARYSGTGGALIGADGKKGSAYEYYTPRPIAEGVWSLLGELGFTGGKVLDPCAGVGIFGATAPLSAAIDAVELNPTSGRINGLVNSGPGYTATVSPFEAIAAGTPDEQYDAVVTNVPFGGVADRGGNQLKDPRYQGEPLQNYFILRSLEKLRPGGLAVFITPPRCVSGKGGKEEELRVKVSYQAEFLGAYRLPNLVFGTAAADTMTDVIALRKYSRDTLDKIAELREQDPDALVTANVQWQPFIEGAYFVGEGRPFVLGTLASAKNRFGGDMEVLNSDRSVSDIAKMIRRFGPSRVNWDLLGATETAPIVYRDGDTITQAGETLQMRDGQWVPLAKSTENVESTRLLGTMANPYAAFEAGASWDQASNLVGYLITTSQATATPTWLASSVAMITRCDLEQREGFWTAGLAGMAAAQVLEENLQNDTPTNYLSTYPALSDALVRAWPTAKKRPGAISGGALKDGMATVLTHYDKKAGYSAVWRGDVLTEVTQANRTADGSFDGLLYQSKSRWASLDDARGVFGPEFDPLTDPAWCISGDGTRVARDGDYYVGSLATLLSDLDAQIAAAPEGPVRDKLLRMKIDADGRVDRVDTSAMQFNLFSPHVTVQEKAEFLRRFVDPRFAVMIEKMTSTGGVKSVETVDAYIGYDVAKYANDEDRLNARLAQYMQHGTLTLGDAKNFDANRKDALQALKRKVQTANEQFNAWVKTNRAITDRLERVANDPTKLRFRAVDDEDPIAIAGINPDAFPLKGYQASYVRKMGREFGGINGYGVGLGKTYTALAAVQHVQNMGVKKKTIFVVPNSVMSKWRKEAVTGAGTEGEPGYLAPIYASGDDCLFVGLREKGGKPIVDSKYYDADFASVLENRHAKIFCSLEAFERIRLRPDTIEAYDGYLRTVDASYAEVEDKKQDEKNKSKKAGLIEALTDKIGSAPYLEDMGIDSVVFDEAHTMKNSTDVSDFKGGKYLSIAGSSGRGIDAQCKAWYIRGMSPAGDGVLLLTATPITNSPLEIYSMLALAVGSERVNDLCVGVRGADDFMNTMCEVVTEPCITMDGIEVEIPVFQGLMNVNILRGALGNVACIKDKHDVGEQVVVPEEDEKKTPIDLPESAFDRLTLYQSAYRYALDTMSKRSENRGDPAAYATVQAHFGEPMALIGHPFNLMRKMEKLILDPELDRLGSFYTFSENHRAQAQAAVDAFNKLKIKEKRARPSPFTTDEMVVGRKVVRDAENGTEKTTLTVQVRAIVDGTQVVIDTTQSSTQSAFEAVAAKAGMDLDVTVPPKLAALIANVQEEQAHPRGRGADGETLHIVKQLIFCDRLAMHNKIRIALAKRAGIPPGTIAIITGQTNNKPDEIMEVQDGFNSNGEDNKYRVVIANEKAEVGINLQIGTQAIHHLSIGDTPDSLTQRNGRGVRQGNLTNKVNVYYYDAGGTFDAAKRTMVNRKASWINEVTDLDGGNNVKVSGGLTPEEADMLASLIGNTDGLAKAQEELDAKKTSGRAATNRDRQIVNIGTITKQREFLDKNPDAEVWAARKIYAYALLKKQSRTLRDRAARSTSETARARTEGQLADIQARANGLKEMIEAGVKLEGEKTLDEFVDRFTDNDKWTKLNEENIRDRLNMRAKSGMRGLTVAPDSQLANDWQSEVDMAQSMIDESRANFARQAAEDGAYPAAIVDAIAEGKGQLINGVPVVHGSFIRTKGDLVVVYGTVLRDVLGTIYVAPDTLRISTDLSAFDALVRDKGEIVYPGAAGYDACLTDAAALEDRLTEAAKDGAPYSAVVPEVATRCKAEKLVCYDMTTKVLPSPYFPFVYADYLVKGGSQALKDIAAKQSEVVKKIDYYGFYCGSSVAVEDAPEKQRDARDAALIGWVSARGEMLRWGDLSLGGISVAAWLARNVTTDAIRAALSGTTIDEVVASLKAFIQSAVNWMEWLNADREVRIDYVALLGEDQRAILDEVLNPIKEEMSRTAAEAAAAAEAARLAAEAERKANQGPDDVVGLKGPGTREWKDKIKDYGGRYRPASHHNGYAWDGPNVTWWVSRQAADKLFYDYPRAAQSLRVVESETSWTDQRLK